MNFRKDNVDRRLSILAIIGLLFFTLLLLDDLRIINLGVFYSDAHTRDRDPAGQIVLTQNTVKSRGPSDLIWQSSREQDDVYFYDSILTMNESQAKILINQSEIILSENTLVVIEPPSENEEQQLRIKFKSGSLSSKNNTQPTDISNDNWQVTLRQGSQFQISAKENGEMKLELIKGEAKVQGHDKSEGQVISEPTQIELSKDGEITQTKINDELSWSLPQQNRIYSLNGRTSVNLKWSGTPQSIYHTQKAGNPMMGRWPATNETQSEISVHQNTEHNLELSNGTHEFQLKDKNEVSQKLFIQVWQAPSIHLYSPLPRDRRPIGSEIKFSWRRVDIAKSYQWQISEDPNFSRVLHELRTDASAIRWQPNLTGTFYWRVIAFDQDGFKIPEPYSNQIHIIHSPLEAPEPSDPSKSESKNESKSSSRGFTKIFKSICAHLPVMLRISFSLLTNSTALANDNAKVPVKFLWKPVTGAKTYTIEIDDDPYFQSPEVIEDVSKTEFIWNAENKTYYWRVAGNGATMGLFSPVQTVQISQIKNQPNKSDFTVALNPPEKLALPPAAVTPPAETQMETQEVVPIEPVWKPKRSKLYFGVGSSFSAFGSTSNEYKRLSFVGMDSWSAQIGSYVPVSNGQYIKIDSSVRNYKWRPRDKVRWPLQSDMNVRETHFSAALGSHDLYFGVAAHEGFNIRRKSDEEIKSESQYLFGPKAMMDWFFAEKSFATASFSALFGSSSLLLGSIEAQHSIVTFGSAAPYVGSKLEGRYHIDTDAPLAGGSIIVFIGVRLD